MHPNKEEDRKKCQDACIDEQGAPGQSQTQIEAYRGSKQGQVRNTEKSSKPNISWAAFKTVWLAYCGRQFSLPSILSSEDSLEHCVQLCVPQYKKDTDLIKQVQKTKGVQGPGAPFPGEKADRVGVVQRKEQKALGRPQSSLSVPKGAYRKARDGPFTRAHSNSRGEYYFRLKKGKCRLDFRN